MIINHLDPSIGEEEFDPGQDADTEWPRGQSREGAFS